MYNKIENYVNVLFSDVPKSQRASELKEEILSNLSAHYNDCIADGMSENEAYTKAVSSLGDIDQLLAELEPDAQALKSQIDYYRIRRAKITAISVAMYIIGVAIVVASSLTDNETVIILAVVLLLLMTAIATAMIIYVNMTIPHELRPYLSDDDEEEEKKRDKNQVLESITAAYWLLVVAAYFGISFLTGRWGITWIIWIISPALYQLIKIPFINKK